MRETLDQILRDAGREAGQASSTAELEALRVKYLGKKGAMTLILRQMGSLSPQERPIMGKLVNECRASLETMMAEKEALLRGWEKQEKLTRETLDVTLPGKKPLVGSLHPSTHVQRELEDIFIGMGFEIAEGPEVELDYFNFELLNLPKDHAARDMHDSMYITDTILLRTHTSPVQARTMLAGKPPIRIICPGRVYRFDEVDATHSPVFHQIEGLVVDKGIHMGHLLGTLDAFAKELYGPQVKTRCRPSYFPFTEPSAEVDISCYLCGGEDPNCRVCHGSGWLEILGCGMVNPHVLEMCGIDPDVYSGFAFGMGWDRVANIKYGISDLRLNFENDLRFLTQI